MRFEHYVHFRATFNESRMYKVAYLDARVSDRPEKACDSSLTKLNSSVEHHKYRIMIVLFET